MPIDKLNYEQPTTFFIAKLVVPMDSIGQVIQALKGRIDTREITMERQEYHLQADAWTLTLYCQLYGVVVTLVRLHKEGLVDEFRII